MSELDVAKEQIAYLKLWLAILAVIGIGLMNWLAYFDLAYKGLAVGALVLDVIAGVLVDRKIRLKIEQARRL
jgi:uncharacterized membrane protein YhfC